MSAQPYEEDTIDQHERHPGIDRDCAILTRILRGRAAEALLEHPEGIPERAGIVLLPAWGWRVPLLDIGRKGKAFFTGAPLLMCVRATWTVPYVALVDADGPSVEAGWRMKGMGHTDAGQTRLVRRPGLDPVVAVDALEDLAGPVMVGAATRHQVIAELRRIAEDGRSAFWDKAESVKKDLQHILVKAHSAVSHEIGKDRGYARVLDETALEDVETELLYGTDGREGSLARGLELSLQAARFEKVDPAKFMSTHLRRDAEMAIRRRIGDPHIGPKIREVARQHPGAAVETIIEKYRQAYPADRLGEDRVEAALSAGAHAMARTTALNPETAYPTAVHWEAA